MQLNIKNERVYALARELSDMTGESLTTTIRVALEQRMARETARIEPRASVEEILALVANVSDEEQQVLRAAERDLFDDDGIPA